MPYDKKTKLFSNIDPRELIAMAKQHQASMQKKITDDIARYGKTSFTYPMGSIDETAKMIKMQDYLRPMGDDLSDETMQRTGQDVADKMNLINNRGLSQLQSPYEDEEYRRLEKLSDKLKYMGSKRGKRFI